MGQSTSQDDNKINNSEKVKIHSENKKYNTVVPINNTPAFNESKLKMSPKISLKVNKSNELNELKSVSNLMVKSDITTQEIDTTKLNITNEKLEKTINYDNELNQLTKSQAENNFSLKNDEIEQNIVKKVFDENPTSNKDKTQEDQVNFMDMQCSYIEDNYVKIDKETEKKESVISEYDRELPIPKEHDEENIKLSKNRFQNLKIDTNNDIQLIENISNILSSKDNINSDIIRTYPLYEKKNYNMSEIKTFPQNKIKLFDIKNNLNILDNLIVSPNTSKNIINNYQENKIINLYENTLNIQYESDDEINVIAMANEQTSNKHDIKKYWKNKNKLKKNKLKNKSTNKRKTNKIKNKIKGKSLNDSLMDV